MNNNVCAPRPVVGRALHVHVLPVTSGRVHVRHQKRNMVRRAPLPLLQLILPSFLPCFLPYAAPAPYIRGRRGSRVPQHRRRFFPGLRCPVAAWRGGGTAAEAPRPADGGGRGGGGGGASAGWRGQVHERKRERERERERGRR